MRRDFQAKEAQRNKQIADLQQQLQAEKNKPAPQPSGGGRRKKKCVLM